MAKGALSGPYQSEGPPIEVVASRTAQVGFRLPLIATVRYKIKRVKGIGTSVMLGFWSLLTRPKSLLIVFPPRNRGLLLMRNKKDSV